MKLAMDRMVHAQPIIQAACTFTATTPVKLTTTNHKSDRPGWLDGVIPTDGWWAVDDCCVNDRAP